MWMVTKLIYKHWLPLYVLILIQTTTSLKTQRKIKPHLQLQQNITKYLGMSLTRNVQEIWRKFWNTTKEYKNNFEHMKMNIKFMIRETQHHEDSNSPYPKSINLIESQ